MMRYEIVSEKQDEIAENLMMIDVFFATEK